MNFENDKCVIVIDENLPLGIIANTAAILGITLGMKNPSVVGCDVKDADNNIHSGIIEFPVPILKSNKNSLNALSKTLKEEFFDDLTIVDFTDLAQSCKTYDEYISKMTETPAQLLNNIGLLIYGNKKKVNKLTGNMPLLR